jgi:LuxR family transcriptional regulator, activator of conjugal transfer of Ti plasmids
MVELLHVTADICFQIEQASSVAPVRKGLRAAAEVLGADFFLFSLRIRTMTALRQVFITDYPELWQRYYDATGAYVFDPVIGTALESTGAFRWDGLYETPAQIALQAESIRCGMGFGFSCVDRVDRAGTAGIAFLSFCGSRPLAQEPGQWERAATAAGLLIGSTRRTVRRLVEQRADTVSGQTEPLSDSERQCLEFTAQAKTAAEVAKEMGVAEATVRYYLDRSALKLGARTRREAVLKALESGLIDTRTATKFGFKPSERLG